MSLCDAGPTNKHCFVYCGDDRCDCQKAPRYRGQVDYPVLVDLPPMKPDQVEYLKTIADQLVSTPISAEEERKLAVHHATTVLASLMLRYGKCYDFDNAAYDDAMLDAEAIVNDALASDEDRSVLNRQIGELQSTIGRLQAELARRTTVTKPCGGCGAKSDSERCIGCLHDFGDAASAWVRNFR